MASYPAVPRPERPAGPPRTQTTRPTPTERPFDLVSANKTVGHRNFANAKKILPRIDDGMEQGLYCGDRYVAMAIDCARCGDVAR